MNAKTLPKQRLLLITDHLAPYNLPVFAEVRRREEVDIEVVVLFGRVSKHNYWPEMEVAFPLHVLSPADEVVAKRKRLNWDVVRIIRRGSYDVIGVSGYSDPTQALALFYCMLAGKPFLWILDSILQTSRGLIRRVIKNIPTRMIVSAMGAAWVPGVASFDYLRFYGAKPVKIYQGCYCLDAVALGDQASSVEPKRAQMRKELGLRENSFAFLFVGRMIKERGLSYLMRSFRALRAGRPEAALILVGTGPERPWVEQFVKDQGLSGVLVLDPVPVDHLAKYYVASDCYVHPSIAETYSLTTAHAAIVGRPLIVTDQVGAAQDYLIEGQTGYGAHAGNSESLRHAMEKMMDTPIQVREAMGRRAKEIAVMRTIDWAVAQLEAAVLFACKKR